MTDRRRPAELRPPRLTQTNIRMSEPERDEMKRRAAEAGLDITAFVRKQCLGSAGYRAHRIPPVELVELKRCMTALDGISPSLYGLYRIASLGEIPCREELVAAVEEHTAILRRLMTALGRPG